MSMHLSDSFNHPFLTERLNPLFLEILKGYWSTLGAVKISEEDTQQLKEAQYNLIRFTLKHLFQALYLKHVPSKISGSIFLLSAIHSDGIGDFMTTLKCAKLLKDFYPNLDVHVVYTHKQHLPSIDPRDYGLKSMNIHAFQETSDPTSVILEPILEGRIESTLEGQLDRLLKEKHDLGIEYERLKESHSQAALAIKEMGDSLEVSIRKILESHKKQEEALRLYQNMQESLGLIHIALAINTFDNPMLAAKSIYFAETGNFQGIGNYLQRHWYSLGLDPLEEGIFLKKQEDLPQWVHTRLSQYIWGVEQPNPAQIKDYLDSHSLHVGYLPRHSLQREIFIELVSRSHMKEHLHIDILLPSLEEDLSFGHEWMGLHRISKIIKVNVGTQIHEEVIEELEEKQGRIVRLICALPLPSTDFTKYIQLSDDIVGCTGDGSLSDCIIAGKMPFYEVRPHKLKTLETFRHLAIKQMMPDVLEYFELLQQFASWPSESFTDKFEKVLNRKSFKLQWKALLEFIKRYYCFEDSFIAHVSRHLIQSLSPDVKNKEEVLIRDFFEGLISVETAYTTLETILINHQ